MSNKLVDMELDEISLVKKGANQFSTVSIAKSLSSEEEEMEELFDENGDLVDAEELDYGDVVFDSDGNAFEVTPDDDDDDGDDDEEFVEKSLGSSLRWARNNSQMNSARKARKAVKGAQGAIRESRGLRGQIRRAEAKAKLSGLADTARYATQPGSPGNVGSAALNSLGEAGGRVRNAAGRTYGKVADSSFGSAAGRAYGRVADEARGLSVGFQGGLGARGADRAGRAALRDQTRLAGGSAVGYHVGGNAMKYGVGAGAAGAAGVGGYEYNRRRNVGKSLREEFSKALTDDDRESVISKAMDAISQLEEQNEIALEIAKSEQEQRIFNDYVSIAKTYDLPFEDDVVASAMMEAEANLSEEACAVIAKSFELASNLITQEIGYDELGSDAMYVVDDALDEIGKSGDPEAITQLLENNPELYEAYLAEKN